MFYIVFSILLVAGLLIGPPLGILLYILAVLSPIVFFLEREEKNENTKIPKVNRMPSPKTSSTHGEA